MSFSHRLLVLVPYLIFGLATASEPLLLQPAQVQALGIATAVAGEAATAREAALPARVLVPNEQTRIIAAPVGGLIEMLAVAPGAAVRRGQVVARLVSPEALALQRDALQADSQAALLRQNLQRDEQLFAEGLIPQSRLQATRAAAAQAGAQARERQAGLALSGVARGKLGGPLVLTAPIDGVVIEQSAQLGQRVEASAPIYRIASLSPLWLEIQAPVDRAAALREGMTVKIAGSEVAATLIAIGRMVDPASQTVLLRASVVAGAQTLSPGQIVEVALPPTRSGAGQTLPAGALARHAGKTFVFVQAGSDEAGARFEARPVRVLGQGGDGVVVEGIAAGERVAVKGVSGLKALLAGVGQD